MVHKVLTVVGARPQFIKAAAVSRAFKGRPGLSETMVHTGQHFDKKMSDIFFQELEIPAPLYNLEINGGGHGKMTGRMLEYLEQIMVTEKPDMVLVYGDTNSTIAGALAAAKLIIPVAHVEAGLRSFNSDMPEEVNRVLTDHVSSLLFCPTQTAKANLLSEGISGGVYNVGDVMFDASVFALEKAHRVSNIQAQLKLEPDNYAVSTIHRAENTNNAENLEKVLNWLKSQANDMTIVFLYILGPEFQQRFGLDFDGLMLCEPVGYLDMAKLISGAKVVYTDSGGLQKEAYFHKKPCVTLREQTEWVETIENGWNRLWSSPSYKERKEISEYGEGNASELILDKLKPT